MAEPSLHRRISLRDIGRLANLSHATVSLALRDHPSIAAKTRNRVQELAASLGYVPDPMLSALAEYRRNKVTRKFQGSIAWISYHPTPQQVNANVALSQYRVGAEERANELGYNLVPFSPTVDAMTPGALRRILINRGIRGLLFPPQPESHRELDFDFSGFSVVTYGFSIATPHLHTVTNYQFHSSVIAVQKLRSFGHRRLGFIISESLQERSAGNFLGGFLTEQIKMRPAERIPALISESGSAEKQRKEFRQWYRSHRPTAIVADVYEWTMIQMDAMEIHVPEDVSLAILSVVSHRHQFAGVNQNDRQIGRLGVDTLVGTMYRNETGVPTTPIRVLVEGQWQDGESVLVRNTDFAVKAE